MALHVPPYFTSAINLLVREVALFKGDDAACRDFLHSYHSRQDLCVSYYMLECAHVAGPNTGPKIITCHGFREPG